MVGFCGPAILLVVSRVVVAACSLPSFSLLVLPFTGHYGEGGEILREVFFWSNVPHRAGVARAPQSQIPDISVLREEGARGLIPAWGPSATVTRPSIPDGLRVPQPNQATERSVFNVILPFPGLGLRGGWPSRSRDSARFCHRPCLPTKEALELSIRENTHFFVRGSPTRREVQRRGNPRLLLQPCGCGSASGKRAALQLLTRPTPAGHGTVSARDVRC
jgi:hypothetical protein